MRKYYVYNIKSVIKIKNLVTFESCNFDPEFHYPEEIHQFSEIIYVRNGTLNYVEDKKTTRMITDDFILISPSTPHSLYTSKNERADALIICFNCNSEVLDILTTKITLNEELKEIIDKILIEAKDTFKFPFNKKIELLANPCLGSQQLIENHLEELLIKLLRFSNIEKNNIQFISDSEELKKNIVQDIKSILSKNLYNKITLTTISEKIFYSKTYINNIFKELTSQTIMQYYYSLKIEESKKLLKQKHSASEVSEMLLFESPNYFTKVFKKKVGITPSQYAVNNATNTPPHS